ncbi:PREDICTED: uncharacterized protein LOC108564473 [Nicrophorus vespilloides]|uniref:Uncharacterized protein LOC108564473 n=1 Tax=Nicrophorus vespilloides TaxID=110193 RepID=A0ABM1MWS3_NICVS|nr:PREDICTED: uncharacterized protein LOC108564473 [Nicrophorus vespilloides]
MNEDESNVEEIAVKREVTLDNVRFPHHRDTLSRAVDVKALKSYNAPLDHDPETSAASELPEDDEDEPEPSDESEGAVSDSSCCSSTLVYKRIEEKLSSSYHLIEIRRLTDANQVEVMRCETTCKNLPESEDTKMQVMMESSEPTKKVAENVEAMWSRKNRGKKGGSHRRNSEPGELVRNRKGSTMWKFKGGAAVNPLVKNKRFDQAERKKLYKVRVKRKPNTSAFDAGRIYKVNGINPTRPYSFFRKVQ